ncbi:MAG: hypothetical protein RSA29_10425 [Clostridium sp.]|uniref:hypothetical protein n=1 Tax=Clostridium sp. TaxID=1506 RepID=UPI003217E658
MKKRTYKHENKHIHKYKRRICEQFNISKEKVIITDYESLIYELEKNYKRLISSKNRLLVEMAKVDDEIIHSKPFNIEGIFIPGFTLIITIMLAFANDFRIPFEVAYDILLKIASGLMVVSIFIKLVAQEKLMYSNGYSNMCLRVLKKIENEIENEIEVKNILMQAPGHEVKLDEIHKELKDIKKFIGIK